MNINADLSDDDLSSTMDTETLLVHDLVPGALPASSKGSAEQQVHHIVGGGRCQPKCKSLPQLSLIPHKDATFSIMPGLASSSPRLKSCWPIAEILGNGIASILLHKRRLRSETPLKSGYTARKMTSLPARRDIWETL